MKRVALLCLGLAVGAASAAEAQLTMQMGNGWSFTFAGNVNAFLVYDDINSAGVDRSVERAQKIRASADSARAQNQPKSQVPLPGMTLRSSSSSSPAEIRPDSWAARPSA